MGSLNTVKPVRLVAALCLGGATSFIVAWGIATTNQGSTDTPEWQAWPVPGSSDWVVACTVHANGISESARCLEAPLRIDDSQIQVVSGGYADAPWSVKMGTGPAPDGIEFVSGSNRQWVVSAGWPFRCFRRSLWESAGGCLINTIAERGVWHPNWIGRVELPYEPIPAGLAADSVVWGVPWWAALSGTTFARRWWRRRHQQCESCGYSLRGLPELGPCPECGALASRPAIVATGNRT